MAVRGWNTFERVLLATDDSKYLSRSREEIAYLETSRDSVASVNEQPSSPSSPPFRRKIMSTGRRK